ncbi:hypothetical protein PDE_05776 [Penicillium oxalicum 114-2]|uniref:Uncharacterized protein n=1 Tax=Penicillium oxalicum (strain 114-2 / CGMCC 5302) TaxID=933388 RepID=S7ZKL5_PENO1|nr:hypothetical protein PDE_05776 [Penicillium oxalicum 114-2]
MRVSHDMWELSELSLIKSIAYAHNLKFNFQGRSELVISHLSLPVLHDGFLGFLAIDKGMNEDLLRKPIRATVVSDVAQNIKACYMLALSLECQRRRDNNHSINTDAE